MQKLLKSLIETENKGFKYNPLSKKYDKKYRPWREALRQVKRKARELKKQHEKDARLRIAYVDGRIKPLPSIIRKSLEENIPASKVFHELHDIVGVRIVVNNLRDVSVLKNEIKGWPEFKLENENKHTKQKGYRAIHLKGKFNIGHNIGRKNNVRIEIQICTLLQDAWAILAHHDIYRNKKDLPKLASSIPSELSSQLASLDRLSDDFRKEIEKDVIHPNDLSDEAALDEEGVAFLYYEIFGKNPQQFQVQYLSEVASNLGITKIKMARQGLTEGVFNRLNKIHNDYFPDFKIGEVDLFEYGLLFVVQNHSAFKEFRKRVKKEWDEINEIAKREILYSMPENIDEFIKLIMSNEVPWEAIKELGGTKRCFRCGTEILDSLAAAESVCHFYNDLSDDKFNIINEEITQTYDLNAPEEASFGDSDLCSACYNLMIKD